MAGPLLGPTTWRFNHSLAPEHRVQINVLQFNGLTEKIDGKSEFSSQSKTNRAEGNREREKKQTKIKSRALQHEGCLRALIYRHKYLTLHVIEVKMFALKPLDEREKTEREEEAVIRRRIE